MYQQYLDMGQNWAPNNWIVNEYSIGHNWTNICGPPGLLFWPTPMLVGGFLSSEKWWSSSVGMTIPNYTYTNPTIYKLVGGFNPSENMSQLGWLFPYIMEKKQHVPHHQPAVCFPTGCHTAPYRRWRTVATHHLQCTACSWWVRLSLGEEMYIYGICTHIYG